MIELNPTAASAGATPRAADKQIATLTAQAALAGAQLVAIEGDDGGVELLLTEGAATLRFHDLHAANSAIVARRDHSDGADRHAIVLEGRRA